MRSKSVDNIIRGIYCILLFVLVCFTAVCSLGGVISLIAALFGADMYEHLLWFAVGCFGAMATVFIVCITYGIYEYIRQRVVDKC